MAFTDLHEHMAEEFGHIVFDYVGSLDSVSTFRPHKHRTVDPLRKLRHQKELREARAGRKCLACGDLLSPKFMAHRLYCSASCLQWWRRYKHPRPPKQCQACRVPLDKKAPANKIYCSMNCATYWHKFRRERPKPEDYPNCTACGVRLKHLTAQFCGEGCRSWWKRKGVPRPEIKCLDCGLVLPRVPGRKKHPTRCAYHAGIRTRERARLYAARKKGKR